MYCNDSVCRRGMTFGTGVGVHETNYATKVFRNSMGNRVRSWANAPTMGNLLMLAIVFVPDLPKFKQIWRSI